MYEDFIYDKFGDGIIIQGYFGVSAEIPFEILGKKAVAVEQIYYRSKKDVLNGKITKNGKMFSYYDLKNIKIGANVRLIKCYAFYGSRNLETVVIGENVKEIENSVFMDCSKLKVIDLRADINEISYEMFKNCASLKEIKLHSKIEKIGAFSFEKCVNLCNINLENVRKIGKCCFSECLSLAEVRLKKILEIGKRAFAGCIMLSYFEIDECQNIGDDIFIQCGNLHRICVKYGFVDLSALLRGINKKIYLILKYSGIEDEIILPLDNKDFFKCFDKTDFNYSVYDDIGANYPEIAIKRIKSGFNLSIKAKEQYRKCLCENIDKTLEIVLNESSPENISILFENKIITDETIAKAAEILGANKELRACLTEYFGMIAIKEKDYVL